MIDAIDRQILALLQPNARISNSEIARRIGMAPSAVLERIRKLEKRGVIRGYETRIDPVALDAELLAFVYVTTNETASDDSVGQQLVALPEVLEVHHVAGEDCYLAKVRAAGTQELGQILQQSVGRIPCVVSTRTTIVLSTLKEGSAVALAEVPEEMEGSHD